ncbi:hypothetical protein GC093_01845 [Paenibacillus sp. LMG 31456]|uniref:Treble clef zinc finger domain-containing protein n=1 Tax=Paenibacillus foliorum TaxID=2654974 RepID=A0A972GPE8_9BACL|nr:zinc-ribbon domain-containing protein [Paenibacillus foliorum]NOU91979.1 hypothetical protein [Paenibacillus foliorum]
MKNKKYSIKDMRLLAQKREGLCLSEEYITATSHLWWKCKNPNHDEWRATPNKIMQGRWCPKCGREVTANKQRGAIEEMVELATRRNGKCLSTDYVNNNTKLLWECEHGHTWLATSEKIKGGRWCPKCGINRRSALRRSSLEIMQQLAKKQNGECLSTQYTDSQTKLTWKCEKGHVFDAQPNNVSYGKWCPRCSNEKVGLLSRLPFEVIVQAAAEKGGACLSNEDDYFAGNSLLMWQCSEGHIWKTRAASIRRGSWCPVCNRGFNERKCHLILEELLGKPFEKNRDVLEGYELDGYNAEIGIAFEYHGLQHYEYVEIFHRSIENFHKQKERDRFKRKLCENKGICLISVPYTVSHDDTLFSNFIYLSLKKKKIDCKPPRKDLDLKTVRIKKTNDLLELKRHAENRGGTCLSEVYLGSEVKLPWKCAKGHIWEAIPYSVKSGTWCPVCGSLKMSIEEMHETAASRGGKCLSETYVNNITPLLWVCSENHEWYAKPTRVKAGSWCPVCDDMDRRKKHYKEVVTAVESKGGKCLSVWEDYTNNRAKLQFECSHGHQWQAIPTTVKKGSWCPWCYRGRKTESKLSFD